MLDHPAVAIVCDQAVRLLHKHRQRQRSRQLVIDSILKFVRPVGPEQSQEELIRIPQHVQRPAIFTADQAARADKRLRHAGDPAAPCLCLQPIGSDLLGFLPVFREPFVEFAVSVNAGSRNAGGFSRKAYVPIFCKRIEEELAAPPGDPLFIAASQAMTVRRVQPPSPSQPASTQPEGWPW
jgi:hypothetical protein